MAGAEGSQYGPIGRTDGGEDCVGLSRYLASPGFSGYAAGKIAEINGGQLMP